jgi:hypothetical protein
MRALPAALALPLVAALPSLAQPSLDLPDEIDGADALAQAAGAVLEETENALLLADLIGREVTGPDGEALGTVEDLAALPGGRLVAALIALEDGPRIAVPYQALKVSRGADALEAALPVGADDLSGIPELEDLASGLDGG